MGDSAAPTLTVDVELSGLVPGSTHAVQILPGACGSPAPTSGIILSQIFNPPEFTLNNVTAGPDGRGSISTVLTAPSNVSGPGQFRIPSAGWYVNVSAGPNADGGATSVACGNVRFHSAAVMRDVPSNLRIRVGDTVEWNNDSSNEVHGVTFLAGQPLPVLPEWYAGTPTGDQTDFDGSTFADSAALYGADSGRNHSFTLTFTKPGTFSYVDAGDFVLGMTGTVTVRPAGGSH
jgi:plastocyanin